MKNAATVFLSRAEFAFRHADLAGPANAVHCLSPAWSELRETESTLEPERLGKRSDMDRFDRPCAGANLLLSGSKLGWRVECRNRGDSELKPQTAATRAGVIRCLMEGMKNAQIAKELGIADRTVKSYLDGLYHDYGVPAPHTPGWARARLAVLIFQAGDCPCALCAAADAEVSKTMHVERRGPESESVLDVHGHRANARASGGL